MNKRHTSAIGFMVALGVGLLVQVGTAQERLQWESGKAIAWHRACAFAHSTSEATPAPSHRFLTLKASLTTLSRADMALYAVYLEDAEAIDHLADVLGETGAPPAGEGIVAEWIPMGTSGSIAIRVDEANHPDKELLVVVNGSGEILGTHPLWTDRDDLAALHPKTD